MRILFIGHTRIGDAVLSTGLLQALADQNAGARITVACGAVAAPLFAAAPFVERVIPIVKRRYAGHWLDVWRDVVGTRWDLVVDLRHSVIPWTVWTRRRLVHRGGDAFDEHKVVSLSRVLQRADDPLQPRLWSSPEADAIARTLVPEGAPVLALGPTANWRGKIWPAAKFASLAGQLSGGTGAALMPGARVAVFGGPDERELAQPVIDAIPNSNCIDLVGAADLPVIHASLRRCALFIGNDSGLMHMAAAAGIPTIGLFGPSRPEQYGPWGKFTRAVRTRTPYDSLIGAPDYDHRTTGSLMDSLEIDDVVDAARSLLGQSASTATR